MKLLNDQDATIACSSFCLVAAALPSSHRALAQASPSTQNAVCSTLPLLAWLIPTHPSNPAQVWLTKENPPRCQVPFLQIVFFSFKSQLCE